MRRFDREGKPARRFCEQEVLSAGNFYHWRRQLRGRTQGRALAVQPGVGGFFDLCRLTGPAPDPCGAMQLRLDLGGGVALQIVRR